MPVFHNLMAVGVSGAITFIYLGQGIAVPPSTESAERISSQNSISEMGSAQDDILLKSGESIGDAAKAQKLPVQASDQPSQVDSNTLEASLKQNPTKPDVTLQRIIDKFVSPGSEKPTEVSGEMAFKENPVKPPTTGSTPQPSILNNFNHPVAEKPTEDSGEMAFKENPVKPTPSQPSIFRNFTTPVVEKPTEDSGEIAFKENPVKPTPSQPSIFRNFTTPVVEKPVEDSGEIAFKENPVKPTPSQAQPSSNPIEVALTDNEEKSSNPTPNLFELSRMLPQPPSANLPPQIAQEVDTPAILETPDLRPPNEPFPPPTPDGTLQTNPPTITLPSSNPLYRPNRPQDVEIRETVPITLAQAVDLARRNNEEVRVFELQVEQNLAALRSAQAELYPTLSYISSITRSFSAGEDIANRARNREVQARRRQNPELQDQAISLSETFGVLTFDNVLQFQYDFDLSGARGARIRAAEEVLRLARLEFERSVEQLRLNVTESYYNLQEADAEVEIQRAAVRNAQKSLEDAEALERAGVGTRFEVLQARVTLSRVQQDLTNAISNQRTRRRELANILNVSQNVNLIAADSIALAGAWDFTLDESIILAYNNRAELEQELVNRNLADQRRIAARAAQRPSLITTASYNVLGRLDGSGDPFANQGWADGHSIQLQMRWNFFDGGLAKANARQQEINIAIAEERYSDLRNDIRLEVESAFYDLQATFENIGVANLGVEEATEALRLARLRFQAGVGTQLDVINQETDLTRAQNQLLQAVIGYNRSLSRLHRAVSNLPDNNLQLRP